MDGAFFPYYAFSMTFLAGCFYYFSFTSTDAAGPYSCKLTQWGVVNMANLSCSTAGFTGFDVTSRFGL